MSYTIPGQNSGFVRTDPPSTPCTGDFVEKLNCTENGFFFWIGAFCVLVVLCGLCSCFVVAPMFKWYRERGADKTPASDSADGKRISKKTPSSSDPKKAQHWYLHDVLQIGSDDEKEYGPRPFHTTARAPSHGSNRKNSTASNPYDPANPHLAAAAHLRDDRSIGGRATKSGGGWMGAENGRL